MLLDEQYKPTLPEQIQRKPLFLNIAGQLINTESTAVYQVLVKNSYRPNAIPTVIIRGRFHKDKFIMKHNNAPLPEFFVILAYHKLSERGKRNAIK